MAIAPQDVLTVLVAGGRSSRFGQDKATFRWEGYTLLERAVQAVAGVSTETALGLPAPQADEPESWSVLRSTYRVITDEPAGIGPMGSLLPALRAAGTRWVLFLAVDLPLMESAHLQRLLEAASHEVSAVVATRQDRIEPTCALYHSALVPNVERAIASGHYALRALLEGLSIARVPLPDRALTNVNRLADLPNPE